MPYLLPCQPPTTPPNLHQDTRELLSDSAAATAPEQQQPSQRQQQAAPTNSSHLHQADAWQEAPEDEETEAGLPDGVVLVSRSEGFIACTLEVRAEPPLQEAFDSLA